jgi:hypothetical protein
MARLSLSRKFCYATFVDTVLLRGKFSKRPLFGDWHRLSKTIAQRWKDLPTEGRNFYQRIARANQEHYKSVMMSLSTDNSKAEKKPSCGQRPAKVKSS